MLLVLLYLFSYELGVAEPASLGIINGTNADIADYPWMVTIYDGNVGICGGSLISPEWVLTVGHCGVQLEDGIIRAGSSNLLDNKGTFVKVAEITVHPNYTRGNGNISPFNDLALLHLDNEINGTNIATINLPEANAPIPGDSITITGWGDTTGLDDMPTDLKVVTIPIPTIESCVEDYKKIEYVVDPNGEFCAGSFGETKGTCRGDGGGPAEINGTIFGMVSWGLGGCSTSGWPSVLVNVPNYRNWIRDVTGI